jgi:hypothetical protein
MENGKFTSKKGVSIETLFREMGLVLFPQSKLISLKESNDLLDSVSYDKFGYCPLKRVKTPQGNTKLETRISKQTSITTPPNILAFKRSMIRDLIPKNTEDVDYVCVPSGLVNVMIARIGKNRIAGMKYYELLPHVTIYIVWIFR